MLAIQPKWYFQIWSSFSLQNFILPEVLPAGAKGGSKVVFMVFLGLLIIQNLMKCFGNTWACINYHEKSKTIKFSSSKCPDHKRARRRATHLAEKHVLQAKNFKMKTISLKLLKFRVKTLHYVLCPANEASAKIWSGSGFFRRFSALLNRLFIIFIFALQTCIRAQ